MNKKLTPVSVLAILFATAPVQAQTVYPSTSSGTLYPADQYPTAQGQYLQLPQSYQSRTAAPAPPPPSSYLTAPRYVVSAMPAAAPVTPPPAPVVSSSGTDMPPVRAVTVYPQTPAVGTTIAPFPPYEKMPLAQKPAASNDDQISLGTITGVQLGIQASHYTYKETDAGSELDNTGGMTYGGTLNGTLAFNSGWFLEGDVRGSYGSHHYTGATFAGTPVSASQFDDWMFEVRALGGHDFLLRDSFWGLTDLGLSPYSGLGFRFLYDNGDHNPGAYQRYSHYVYLPLGATEYVRLTDHARLSFNNEFDVMIGGWQTTALGDATPGAPDFTNSQNTGYGARGSVMYEWRFVSFGPFIEYWNITHSDGTCHFVPGTGNECLYEPHNTTTELGVQGKVRF